MTQCSLFARSQIPKESQSQSTVTARCPALTRRRRDCQSRPAAQAAMLQALRLGGVSGPGHQGRPWPMMSAGHAAMQPCAQPVTGAGTQMHADAQPELTPARSLDSPVLLPAACYQQTTPSQGTRHHLAGHFCHRPSTPLADLHPSFAYYPTRLSDAPSPAPTATAASPRSSNTLTFLTHRTADIPITCTFLLLLPLLCSAPSSVLTPKPTTFVDNNKPTLLSPHPLHPPPLPTRSSLPLDAWRSAWSTSEKLPRW